LKDDEEILSLKADISAKSLKYDELFVAPRTEAKKAEAIFRAKKVQKSIFSMFSFKKGLDFFMNREEAIEYIDFDTDEDEDYSDVPAYLKGRGEVQEDLEEALFKNKKKIIQKFEVKRGNQRSRASLLGIDRDIINYDVVGEFKCLFVREDVENLIPIPKIKRFLSDQLKTRKYY
jgi:hypothetical protein